MLTFGSLFSGIGGIDLGLERAGMQCRWQSEIDPYASRVLAKHWPNIPNLGDIREINWRNVERTDVVAGGYPCQPFSYAGSRNGADDPRHLWPMFAQCLRVVRPRYALLENVAGHLSLGFGQVLADLASLGYDAEWDCIPAAAVGAPHLRDRVFVIATQRNDSHANSQSEPRQPQHGSAATWPPPMGDTHGKRLEGPRTEQQTARSVGAGAPMAHTGRIATQIPPTGRQSSIKEFECACWWQTEPTVGRVAHGIPRRMDRLRALGNAVVPQVAEHVGRIIMDMET